MMVQSLNQETETKQLQMIQQNNTTNTTHSLIRAGQRITYSAQTVLPAEV